MKKIILSTAALMAFMGVAQAADHGQICVDRSEQVMKLKGQTATDILVAPTKDGDVQVVVQGSYMGGIFGATPKIYTFNCKMSEDGLINGYHGVTNK